LRNGLFGADDQRRLSREIKRRVEMRQEG